MPKHFSTGHAYTPSLYKLIGRNVIPGWAYKGAPRNPFHGTLVSVEKAGLFTWRVKVRTKGGETLVGDFHPRIWTYFMEKRR